MIAMLTPLPCIVTAYLTCIVDIYSLHSYLAFISDNYILETSAHRRSQPHTTAHNRSQPLTTAHNRSLLAWHASSELEPSLCGKQIKQVCIHQAHRVNMQKTGWAGIASLWWRAYRLHGYTVTRLHLWTVRDCSLFWQVPLHMQDWKGMRQIYIS